jgi:hypothetical protein
MHAPLGHAPQQPACRRKSKFALFGVPEAASAGDFDEPCRHLHFIRLIQRLPGFASGWR